MSVAGEGFFIRHTETPPGHDPLAYGWSVYAAVDGTWLLSGYETLAEAEAAVERGDAQRALDNFLHGTTRRMLLPHDAAPEPVPCYNLERALQQTGMPETAARELVDRLFSYWHVEAIVYHSPDAEEWMKLAVVYGTAADQAALVDALTAPS